MQLLAGYVRNVMEDGVYFFSGYLSYPGFAHFNATL